MHVVDAVLARHQDLIGHTTEQAVLYHTNHRLELGGGDCGLDEGLAEDQVHDVVTCVREEGARGEGAKGRGCCFELRATM